MITGIALIIIAIHIAMPELIMNTLLCLGIIKIFFSFVKYILKFYRMYQVGEKNNEQDTSGYKTRGRD